MTGFRMLALYFESRLRRIVGNRHNFFITAKPLLKAGLKSSSLIRLKAVLVL
jgi:hypothetical protein